MVSNGLLYISMLIIFSLIFIEFLALKRNKAVYPWLDAAVSMGVAVCIFLFFNLKRPYFSAFYAFIYDFRIQEIDTSKPFGMIALFFAFEFVYYWLHRTGHEIRWMWASHCVHHSSPSMTIFTSVRLSVTGALSFTFIFMIPLYLIGFSPKSVGLMYLLNLGYQLWIHTDTIPKLGRWFEYIFNTASHHRVHHGRNEEYLDKNYGGVLIVFDRIFKTFKEEDQNIKIDYGLVGKEPSYNIAHIFFYEWKCIFKDIYNARNWRERLQYAFGKPGWKPEREDSLDNLSSNIPPKTKYNGNETAS